MLTSQLFALVSITAVAVAMSGCGRGGGAAMSTGGAGGGGSTGTSALIGQWTLSQQVVDPQHEGFTCQRSSLSFGPNSWSYVRDGQAEQAPVSGYDMTGDSVIVHTLPSEESFTVVNSNTIEGIELTAKCVYTRTG